MTGVMESQTLSMKPILTELEIPSGEGISVSMKIKKLTGAQVSAGYTPLFFKIHETTSKTVC